MFMVMLLVTLINLLCWTGASAQITFSPYVAQATGSHLEFLVSADIDGDGDDDLVAATTYAADTTNDFQLFCWENQNGALLPPTKIPYQGDFTERATSISAGDIDGDGNAEICLAAGDSVKIFDFINGGLVKVFSIWTSITFGINPTASITTGDLNGDGHCDIAVSHENINFIVILYGNGSLTNFNFVGPTIPCTYDDQLLIGRLAGDTVNSLILMRGSASSYGDLWVMKCDNFGPISIETLNNPTDPGRLPRGIAVGECRW